LLATVVTAVSLVAAEVCLRVVPRRWSFRPDPPSYPGEYSNRPSAHFVADSVVGWRMVPGIEIADSNRDGAHATYRANGLGFRVGSTRDTAGGSGRHRVVLLGDSFTFGVGVDYDQTFGSLLQAQLPGVQVVNLALPGFGIDQMWMTLRQYALPLRPDLVVVGFIDDDFDRSLTAYRHFEGFNKPMFVLDHGHLRPATAADRPGSVLGTIERVSALWALWRVVLRRLSYRVPLGSWWNVNRAILDAMQADCDRQRIPVVFVRIPSQGTRPRFRVLRHHFARTGATLIDLDDPGSVPPGVFFPLDGHINATGHRFVAGALLQWIRLHLPGLSIASPGEAERLDGTSRRRPAMLG
jgi:hypothetical protein